MHIPNFWVTHDSSVIGVNSPPPPDTDEEESVVYSVGGLDSSSFDTCVDRCFMIREIGSVRKVPVAGVMKDVYNIILITLLGKSILLSAWQQILSISLIPS